MSYGGDYGGAAPPPGPRRQGQPGRGQREHQQAQMMPIPGREQSRRQHNQPQPTRQQPIPGHSQPPNQGPPQQPPQKNHPYRKRRRWGFGRILMCLFLVFVLFIGGVWLYLEFSIKRVDALEDYDGRPAAASGTNWLVIGSDSRDGLSSEDAKRLSTGDTNDAGGQRTDTMMIAHIPDNDTKPTLLSLPRDSEVKIPGQGTNKINSAYATGGAPLLAKTVEQATGLRMDHYAEIGFGGFAKIVDAIGGVEMCVDKEMDDTMTGVKIPAGCQELDGAQGLGFVRMRHSEATPRSDLDRVANQRKFIGSLVNEISSPATFLNPFDLFPLLSAAPDALTIDSGDHLHNLVGLAWAMRGISSDGVVSTTVPTTSSSLEKWDKSQSEKVFDAMRDDTEIPQDVLVK